MIRVRGNVRLSHCIVCTSSCCSLSTGLRVSVGGPGSVGFGVLLQLFLLTLGVGAAVSSGGVLVLGLGVVDGLLTLVLLPVDEGGFLPPEFLVVG